MSKDAISITKRNALVKSYIAAWKAGMNEPKNNVYTLGQQFHTTGLKLVESVINNKKQSMWLSLPKKVLTFPSSRLWEIHFSRTIMLLANLIL